MLFTPPHTLLIIVLQLHFFFLSVSEQVMSPPVAGAFRERPSKPTTFRKFYERREFPIALSHDSKGHRIAWKVGALTSGILGWLVLGRCHFKDWELCRLRTGLAHSDWFPSSDWVSHSSLSDMGWAYYTHFSKQPRWPSWMYRFLWFSNFQKMVFKLQKKIDYFPIFETKTCDKAMPNVICWYFSCPWSYATCFALIGCRSSSRYFLVCVRWLPGKLMWSGGDHAYSHLRMGLAMLG